MRKPVFITLLTLLPLILWTAGFFRFAAKISTRPDDETTPSEAIVVLTGGAARVETGIRLLKEEKAKKLFISGVNRLIDVKALTKSVDSLPEPLADRITLGHAACDTRQNAIETKQWLEAQDFQTLRLVTAAYHMPRSLTEFKEIIPDAVILPHPVFPDNFKSDEWWKYKGTTMLIASEYTKFLAVKTLQMFPFLRPRSFKSIQEDCE